MLQSSHHLLHLLLSPPNFQSQLWHLHKPLPCWRSPLIPSPALPSPACSPRWWISGVAGVSSIHTDQQLRSTVVGRAICRWRSWLLPPSGLLLMRWLHTASEATSPLGTRWSDNTTPCNFQVAGLRRSWTGLLTAAEGWFSLYPCLRDQMYKVFPGFWWADPWCGECLPRWWWRWFCHFFHPFAMTGSLTSAAWTSS